MKPPRSLRVLGRRVRLRFVSPVTLPDRPGEEFQGMCHGWNNLIELDRTLAHDEVRATAVHEVLHDLAGVTGVALTEGQTCALGSALFAFVRDNPGFMRWVQDRETD